MHHARSPCSPRRNSSRRIWRSLIFSRLAAAICVICFCLTSCSTRNLSRSRWLKAIRSVSIGPSATHESGHFYFAQTGHSHFAATGLHSCIDRLRSGKYDDAVLVGEFVKPRGADKWPELFTVQSVEARLKVARLFVRRAGKWYNPLKLPARACRLEQALPPCFRFAMV